MKMYHGINIKNKHKKTHVLKLHKILYGQRQAGWVWFKHLTSKLNEIGFQKSSCNDCFYYLGKNMFFFYVDDGVFLSSNSTDVEQAINDLKLTGLNLEDRGNMVDYLGINFSH